jgi:hypothetical protein
MVHLDEARQRMEAAKRRMTDAAQAALAGNPAAEKIACEALEAMAAARKELKQEEEDDANQK